MIRSFPFFLKLISLKYHPPPILLLLLSSLSLTLSISGAAVDVQVGPQAVPGGAVILVVDGFGSSYVYPEHEPYALDGSLLGKAVLFNLTGSGARAVDVRVPVPETTQSHSILITGFAGVDPQFLGSTIFDAAREKNYLCLGILERGDSKEVLQKLDATLFLDDNAIHGAEPVPGFRDGVPQDLRDLFQSWRDMFSGYIAAAGTAGYAGYNSWGLDAAADLVEKLGSRHFLLLVNVGAVDSAGQDLGAKGYLETVAALDAPLGRLEDACRRNGALLVITADHGMSFPAPRGKGGHSAAKYAGRLESLRVPLVLLGPGIEELNLGGVWSETDIAPTVLSLLGIPGNLSAEGRVLPIKETYSLRVIGAPEGVQLLCDGKPLANATGDREYNFLGLQRGVYTVKAGGISQEVLVNGDRQVDLEESAALPWEGMKKIVGIILILAINLAGIAIIIRILRKD